MSVANIALSEDDLSSPQRFAHCEVGYTDYLLPFIEEEGTPEQIRFMKNMYNGVAMAFAYQVVMQVFNSGSSKPIESIENHVETYRDLARDWWAVDGATEKNVEIAELCLNVNPSQTKIITLLRNKGYFDPNVKNDEIEVLRLFMGVALRKTGVPEVVR